MTSLIKVLIEEFDRQTSKYALAHQEVCDLSLEELKSVITQIEQTPYEEDKFRPQIITEEYIFRKFEMGVYYWRNMVNTFFGVPRDPFDREQLKEISEVDNIMQGKKKHILWYLDHLLIPLVFMGLLIYVTIRAFIESYTISYYFIVLFGADLFIAFNFPYLLFANTQYIPVRYSYPFKNIFKPLNISYLIIIFSLYELASLLTMFDDIFISQNILIEEILLDIGLIVILPLYGTIALFKNYNKAKQEKERNLHNLYTQVKLLSIDQKNYLSQFIVKAEDTKIITTGLLSKFIIFISLVMSVIPFFITL